MSRINKTGRSRGDGRFVALPFDVLNSPGYLQTSPAARAVLIEIMKRYSGHNNGSLAVSVRDAASACNVSPATAARVLQELDDAGLVEMVEKGSFRAGRRLATTYRIAWKSCNVTGAVPSTRYRQH